MGRLLASCGEVTVGAGTHSLSGRCLWWCFLPLHCQTLFWATTIYCRSYCNRLPTGLPAPTHASLPPQPILSIAAKVIYVKWKCGLCRSLTPSPVMAPHSSGRTEVLTPAQRTPSPFVKSDFFFSCSSLWSSCSVHQPPWNLSNTPDTPTWRPFYWLITLLKCLYLCKALFRSCLLIEDRLARHAIYYDPCSHPALPKPFNLLDFLFPLISLPPSGVPHNLHFCAIYCSLSIFPVRMSALWG